MLNKIGKLVHSFPHNLVLGIAFYLLWYLLFNLYQPSPFADEKIHQSVISQIHQNNYDLPKLPMLLGYHWLITFFSKISPNSSLSLSRFFTVLICVAMIVFYTLIPLQKDRPKSKRSPLLITFLPILFPYSTMVYTDSVALFFIVSGVYFHTKHRDKLASLSLFFACLVRQSNLIWLLFLMAWCTLDVYNNHQKELFLAKSFWWSAFIRHLLSRLFGYAIALGFIGGYFLFRGDILSSNIPANRPQFNMGNFYTLSFFALILWTPIWFEKAQENFWSFFFAVRLKPRQTGIIFFVLTILGSMLIVMFDNLHRWNHHPRFLRNIPLILMDDYLFFRILGVLAFFVGIWFVARFWSLQSNRRYLILLALFTILFLLPHSFVEARYFIVPFVFADFFVNYSDTQVTKLTCWYFSITVVVCLLMLCGLAMW